MKKTFLMITILFKMSKQQEHRNNTKQKKGKTKQQQQNTVYLCKTSPGPQSLTQRH